MYASGGHQRGKSWCKQIRKRRCKINQGKRAKHAAIKEAAPGTPGWFKKVLKRGVPKVFQELSCRRPSCLIPDSSAYTSLIVFCFLLTLGLRLFLLFSSFVWHVMSANRCHSNVQDSAHKLIYNIEDLRWKPLLVPTLSYLYLVWSLKSSRVANRNSNFQQLVKTKNWIQTSGRFTWLSFKFCEDTRPVPQLKCKSTPQPAYL